MATIQETHQAAVDRLKEALENPKPTYTTVDGQTVKHSEYVQTLTQAVRDLSKIVNEGGAATTDSENGGFLEPAFIDP